MKRRLALPVALVAALAGCREDGTHVRRSPGQEEPPPPPPAWCGGADPSDSLSDLAPSLLEPVPRGLRGTLCPPDTILRTEMLGRAGDFGRQYWCERDDDVRHGRWRSYWSDGSLQAEREYRSGQPHGLWRAWYPYGGPWFEHRYDRGLLHGTQVELYEDHQQQRRIELHYHRGQPVGTWRVWNTRGDVVCQRTFPENT